MSSDYKIEAGVFKFSQQMADDFEENGFIIIRNFLDPKEVEMARKCLEGTGQLAKNQLNVGDGLGRIAKLTVWSHPGNDVTGMIARSEKVVNTAEKLLKTDEVYHYHGKLINKDAFTGGTHLWHQDYGYWYNNGCLTPDMMTVFVAIDRCDKSNGCLKILKGSHKCGRIDHKYVGGQQAADIERVRTLKNKLPLMYVELDPGDALFFHCNLLHCSGPNESPNRRWAYLMCYNTKANNPVKKHHHPCYTPLHKVPDSAIKECTNFDDFESKDIMNPDSSTTSINITVENK